MRLFTKLLAVGIVSLVMTTATIAASPNEEYAGDMVPPNCPKKNIKQGERETYRLCQSNGKPIEIEYEYFDKFSTITTFSYRDGKLTKSCENQLGTCIGFVNNRGVAIWKNDEKATVLTDPDDKARALKDLKQSQVAMKLFKLADSRSTSPKATKLQNVQEYFLALPDEFIPEIKQSVRAQLIVPDGEGSDISEGYLTFKVPDDSLPSQYREGLLKKEGEARLFKHQNGHSILGLIVTFCQKPGICQSETRFVEYKAGVWRNVTNAILPKISDKEVAKLARSSVSAPKLPAGRKITTYYGLGSDKLHILHGTCLDQSCGSMSILQAYSWNGRKFVVYQYPESP